MSESEKQRRRDLVGTTDLQSLEPARIWRGPLNERMRSLAKAFGESAARRGPTVDEVFRVHVDEKLGALVTVATAFERVAKYAEMQTKAGEKIDDAALNDLAQDPLFASHYALDFVSPHKAISVMRFKPEYDGNGRLRGRRDFENMTPVYQARISEKAYRQVVAFPLNESSFEDHFEAVVFRLPLVPKVSINMSVPLNRYR